MWSASSFLVSLFLDPVVGSGFVVADFVAASEPDDADELLFRLDTARCLRRLLVCIPCTHTVAAKGLMALLSKELHDRTDFSSAEEHDNAVLLVDDGLTPKMSIPPDAKPLRNAFRGEDVDIFEEIPGAAWEIVFRATLEYDDANVEKVWFLTHGETGAMADSQNWAHSLEVMRFVIFVLSL